MTRRSRGFEEEYEQAYKNAGPAPDLPEASCVTLYHLFRGGYNAAEVNGAPRADQISTLKVTRFDHGDPK